MNHPGHGSSWSVQFGAETPRAAGLSAVDSMPLLIAGRYRVHRLLKEDNGISTFLAHDSRDERPVVVKTTPVETLSTAARLRLEHETSVVSALHSAAPDGRVVAWRDDDTAYLVQPFVAGVPLDQRLLDGPLPAPDTLLIARELLSTLERVHGQGVLHRDIKPANVILDPGSPPEWAVLIDFGLARSSRLPASAGDLPAGTAGFVSPEQAGLIDAHVDERADLYSVGALLFTCLAGRPPFDGPGTPTGPPPGLASLGRSVPGALEALVQRLLRRDPAERYQSAAAARADADEIAQALAAGDEDPRVRIGAHDQRRSLTEPVFVGRTVELAALGRHLEETGSGHGGLVVVEAESGGGKTRLLEELARLAERRGCWILGGQGLDQSGQRPFQTLEGVAAGILEAAADSQIQQRLRKRIGDHAGAIVAAFPELAAVLGSEGGRGGERPPGGEPGAEAYGEAGSLQAVHALLDALGSPERPAVVILDDCQWADPLTAKLVARRQAASGVPGGYVTVVAAFRSDEAGDVRLLSDLKPRLHLRLAPLDASEIAGLVQSMAGPLPRAAVDTVIRLSEGSPFMAAAVLRGMVECGALVGSRDAWELDPVALRGVQASRRAAAFLLRRMDLLSPAALALLSVGAVLGKDFDLALAVALTGQDATSAVPALAEARARRILWVQEDGSRCVFFHDKLRAALLERMAPEERAALHLQAAERIETTDPGRVFELARHFDAAGAAERALPYALEAARLAQAEHSLGLAEAHYRIAARAAANGTDEAKRAAAEGLGEVLSVRGSYAEAREALRSARALATTRRARAQLDWRLGEVDFRCSNLNEARTDLESALAELRRPAPRNHFLLMFALLWQVVVQAAHSLAPRLFLARRPGPMPDDEALAARVYSALASVHFRSATPETPPRGPRWGHWFGSGRLASAWAHLRGLNMAERYPPGPELAEAWAEHAPAATMIPWPGRGIDYAQRSLAVRTTLGDRRGQGRSLSSLGVALYAASDFRGAIGSFQRASGLLDRTADRWEANVAAWHIAMGHYRLGELNRAAEVAEQTYWRAMEIGDRAASGAALSAWSRATGGRIPALATAALAVDTGDAHTTVELLLAEGVRLLHDGLPGDAAAAFGKAADVVRSSGLRQEYVAPVRPWLATALRAEAESCEAFAPGRRRSLLRRARRAARRGARTARAYRNNLPHALRELALAEMMLGSSRKAAALIDESLRVAEQQSARYEHAQSLAARGRMGRSAGWLQAEADLTAGEEALAAILEPVAADGGAEAPVPGAADRFPGMTEAGRSIAAAASLAAVHEAAREAALRLLRGEACRFVDPSGDGDALVRQAVAQGRPVTDRVNGPFEEGTEGGPEPAGIRPAVCAPIEVDGNIVECLYVTRGRNGGLFGPEEERLAGFIAALAGAALEHLVSSEARFASLLERSSDVVTVVDGAGSIQYQSSSLARVFGLDGQELLRTPVAAWVHPDDAEEVSARLHRLASGAATAASLESRLRHADGSWRPVEITFTNLLRDAGVRGIVLNVRELTELRWQETHDPLTGLPNRALFTELVTEALDRARRGGSSPAVVHAGLDDFRAVNDLLGRRAADAVLAAVGKRLKACAGPEDVVARLGGDEFAFLLAGAAEGEGEAVAERIVAQMASPLLFGKQKVRVEASMGIARSVRGQSAADLLAGADLAMRGAKSRARGRYRVFQPRMQSAALERSTLKADLSGALEREELVLHYQPVVDLPSGRVVGVEPLLRWRHPRRGLLMPGDFMPIAEESSHIFELGAWALREACRQARKLPSGWAGSGKGYVSVNVSGRQTEDPRLVDAVRDALAASRLDPSRLVLEISESSLMRDGDAVLGRLAELKDLGVRLAVDDFGTGHSSLRHLHRLPVDMIKIDRTFIEGLGDDAEAELLTDTIIRLGRSLGLTTIAEGVETRAQAERLRELGCDLAQGSHFAHPVDLKGLVSLLAA